MSWGKFRFSIDDNGQLWAKSFITTPEWAHLLCYLCIWKYKQVNYFGFIRCSSQWKEDVIGQPRSTIRENRHHRPALNLYGAHYKSWGCYHNDQTSLWSHREVELHWFLCFKLHLKSLINRSSGITHTYTASTAPTMSTTRVRIKSPMLHNPQ